MPDNLTHIEQEIEDAVAAGDLTEEQAEQMRTVVKKFEAVATGVADQLNDPDVTAKMKQTHDALKSEMADLVVDFLAEMADGRDRYATLGRFTSALYLHGKGDPMLIAMYGAVLMELASNATTHLVDHFVGELTGPSTEGGYHRRDAMSRFGVAVDREFGQV